MTNITIWSSLEPSTTKLHASDSTKRSQPVSLAEMKRRRLRYQESLERDDSEPIFTISTHDTIRSHIPRPKKLSINFQEGYFGSEELHEAISECQESKNEIINKSTSFSSSSDLQDYLSGAKHEASPHSSFEKDQERTSKESRRFSLRKEEFIPALFSGTLSFEKGKSWKTRTFVLSDSGICYERRTNSIGLTFKPKYSSFLVHYKDILEIVHDESCFLIDESCFAIKTSTKRVYLKASSRREMFAWMLALARQRNLSLIDKTTLIY